MEGETERHYIVDHSTSVSKTLTGWATRGFVAMVVEMKKLVFLKDSWQPDIEGIQPEDYWYQVLQEKAKGRKTIGTYSHGSDVHATQTFDRCPDNKQRTITHLYVEAYGQPKAMVGYIHHRVVQSKLYLPLETFRDSKAPHRYHVSCISLLGYVSCRSSAAIPHFLMMLSMAPHLSYL